MEDTILHQSMMAAIHNAKVTLEDLKLTIANEPLEDEDPEISLMRVEEELMELENIETLVNSRHELSYHQYTLLMELML